MQCFLLIRSDEKRQINVQTQDEERELIESGSCEWWELVREQVCNSNKLVLVTQTIFKQSGI